jgi:hypothetical protein
MKNSILILILVAGIAILGYLFINKKDQDNLMQNEQESMFFEEENNVQTPPVTTTTAPTQNNQGSSTNTTPTQPANPPIINAGGQPTQSQIEEFIAQTFSDCSQGDCASIDITFEQDRENIYLVTAIYTEFDDSVSSTKKQWLVLYSNGSITLSQTQPSPNTWRTCHRGNSDGTTGWTTGNCI